MVLSHPVVGFWMHAVRSGIGGQARTEYIDQWRGGRRGSDQCQSQDLVDKITALETQLAKVTATQVQSINSFGLTPIDLMAGEIRWNLTAITAASTGASPIQSKT